MLSKKELLPYLNKEINRFEREVNLYNDEMQDTFDSLIDKVRNIITQRYPNIKLHTYGSYATKLCLPWSDIDIVLNCTDMQDSMISQQSFLKKIEILLAVITLKFHLACSRGIFRIFEFGFKMWNKNILL